jgi:hypothetical protein
MKEIQKAIDSINRNLNCAMIDSSNVIMQLALKIAALEEENAKLKAASKSTGSDQ